MKKLLTFLLVLGVTWSLLVYFELDESCLKFLRSAPRQFDNLVDYGESELPPKLDSLKAKWGARAQDAFAAGQRQLDSVKATWNAWAQDASTAGRRQLDSTLTGVASWWNDAEEQLPDIMSLQRSGLSPHYLEQFGSFVGHYQRETTTFLSLMLATLLGFTMARRVSVRRKTALLQRPIEDLPPKMQPVLERYQKMRREDLIDTGAAAGVTAVDALFHLHQIEPGVLAAVDRVHSNDFSSYNTLVEKLDNAGGADSAAWSGLASLYKGHFGEHVIAENLRAAGHHVTLADSSNQAGWDAIVDGEQVQFKVGLDSGGIEEHLDRYPDIPVITVAEHAADYADNPMVTTLDGVSGEGIEAATLETMEHVDSMGDVAIDFPIVTLALSSYRNLSTVYKGHNDLDTACKFIAIDTAAKGGLGMIGAKIGGTVGTALGPVGTLAGILIGGTVGAVIGGKIARSFKETDLRDAEQNLTLQLATLPQLHAQALGDKVSNLKQQAKQTQPSSFRMRYWPRTSDLARAEVSKRYDSWARQCRTSQGELNGAIIVASRDNKELAALGRTLISEDRFEPAYSKAIAGHQQKIQNAIKLVVAEKNRLG